MNQAPVTVELQCGTLTQGADGIVMVRFSPGVKVHAKEMREVIAAVNRSRCRLVLTDASGVKAATREGLIAGAEDAPPFVYANAIVTGGAISVALGNMFLFVFRPPFRSRLFRDVAAAREWLLSLRPPDGDVSETGSVTPGVVESPVEGEEFALHIPS